jgi:hypothetical protein
MMISLHDFLHTLLTYGTFVWVLGWLGFGVRIEVWLVFTWYMVVLVVSSGINLSVRCVVEV